MTERGKASMDLPTEQLHLTDNAFIQAAPSSSKPRPKQQMIVAVGNWPSSKSSQKPVAKLPTKPKPGDEPSALAIANYRKMHEPKNEGTSVIKSYAASNTGTTSSVAASSGSSSEESGDDGDGGSHSFHCHL